MHIARRLVSLAAWCAAVGAASACYAQLGASPIGNRQVAPLGLEPAWSTMVRVDPSRSRVESLKVFPGLVLAQTSFGMVQAIDAETGRTMWAQSFGEPSRPTMAPGANAKFVAVTNGTTLYAIDRANGALLWQQKLGGSPCAGCALSNDRVFVPLDSGLVEGYLLERRPGNDGLTDGLPKRFSGSEGALAAPVIHDKRVNWTVPSGFVYSSEDAFKLTQFRFRADDKLSAPPTYMPPYLFACSRRGTVYGIDGVTGAEMWRLSAGNSITQAPVAIDGALYVVTETGDMLRIQPRTGAQIWYGRGVGSFTAAGGSRVYVLDVNGRLTVRDAASGQVLGAAATYGFDLPCVNTVSDRIYLASTTGLVQCLRESLRLQPLSHTVGYAIPQPKKEGEAPAADAAPAGDTPAAPAAVDPANPFGAKP